MCEGFELAAGHAATWSLDAAGYFSPVGILRSVPGHDDKCPACRSYLDWVGVSLHTSASHLPCGSEDLPRVPVAGSLRRHGGEGTVERAWHTSDNNQPEADYDRIRDRLPVWCAQDRSHSEVIAEFGEPSMLIGGSNLLRSTRYNFREIRSSIFEPIIKKVQQPAQDDLPISARGVLSLHFT